MTNKDRKVIAAFMIFATGLLVAIAQGHHGKETLTDARLKLEMMFRDWANQ